MDYFQPGLDLTRRIQSRQIPLQPQGVAMIGANDHCNQTKEQADKADPAFTSRAPSLRLQFS